MIWLSWRQFRPQALASAVVLAAIAVILGITGVHLDHLYTAYKANIHTCNALTCGDARGKLMDSYHHVRLIGSLLIGAPAIIGVFWGAPLVARELETGTYRLAWTQGVTRRRWLAVKLGVVGLASAVTAALFSLAVTWWATPYDQVNDNRISPAIFDQRGIVPIAYALFAFALGVTLGILVRRTLAAMALTVVGFVATRMVTQFLVRPHLFSPLHKGWALTPAIGVGLSLNNNGDVSIQTGQPELHGAWVTGHQLVDATGTAPTTAFLNNACARALQGVQVHHPPGPGRVHAPAAARSAFNTCIRNVGARYHEVFSYQPNSRFWEFQWTEAGIFLGFAILLALASWGLVRRRLA